MPTLDVAGRSPPDTVPDMVLDYDPSLYHCSRVTVCSVDAFSALTPLVAQQEGHPTYRSAECRYSFQCWFDLTGALHVIEFRLSPPPPPSSLAAAKSRMIWLSDTACPGIWGLLFALLMPSVLWYCWLGDRKGIQRVKVQNVGMLVVLIWLELGDDIIGLQLTQPPPLSRSVCLRFSGHFPGEPGLASVYWSKGW